jgi:hypothetical protein
MYFIDPNEGDSKDAIEAYCEMTTKSTCILPSPDKIPFKWYNKESKFGYSWFSEIKEGLAVSLTQYYFKFSKDLILFNLLYLKIRFVSQSFTNFMIY